MVDHTDTVAQMKIAGALVGLSGLDLAQYIVIHTAWALRDEGAGLRRKPGGAGFDWKGTHYAGDIISYLSPDGAINVDILGDAGGDNRPAWSPYPPDPTVDQFHVPAIDPGDAPVPVPTPTPTPPAAADLITYLIGMEERLNAHSDANREQILARFETIRKATESIGAQILAKIGLGNLFR